MNNGKIVTLRLDIDAPIKINQDIIYKGGINIMVGQNATGKTLMLKVNFAMGTVMALAISFSPDAKVKFPIEVPQNLDELAQFIFDNTFTKQDFNGTIKAEYERANLSLTFNKGKITSVEYDKQPGVTVGLPVIFMSSDMRTFDDISTYLKIQKFCDTDEKLLEFYRIYDIFYVELLKNKVGEGFTPSPEINKALKESFDFKFEIEKITQDEDTFYLHDKEGKKDLATLSKGQQAIINMTLGASA